MAELRLGLTYDDVVIVPRRSSVKSRRDVSTRSSFTRSIGLETPIVSANMDTVTTAAMAIAMAQLGGIGVLHRFLTVDEQVSDVTRVKRYLTYVIEDPYCIGPDVTISEARAESARHGVTGLLVTDDERRLLGILTRRDMRGEADDTPVTAAMTPHERLLTEARA